MTSPSQSGHWADRPGPDRPGPGPSRHPDGLQLGSTVTVTGAPGRPVLTVVGVADSVTSTADGWVLPGEIAALSRQRARRPQAQMLYRFASAGTAAAVSADVAAVTGRAAAGAVPAAQSYLAVRAAGDAQRSRRGCRSSSRSASSALVMSVLIVANVVSGAVIAGYPRIGVLKSDRLHPGAGGRPRTCCQVAVPAAGRLRGGRGAREPAGHPDALRQNAQRVRRGRAGVPLWVDVTVPLAMLGLTAIGAMLPALRAGRMSAMQAIATGRAPRPAHGYLAHRLLGRLRRCARPVTIGLAAPFARPARTAVTAGRRSCSARPR